MALLPILTLRLGEDPKAANLLPYLLSGLPRLRALDLSTCGLTASGTPESWGWVRGAPSLPLTSADLSGNELVAPPAELLTACPQLHELRLRRKGSHDGSVRALSTLAARQHGCHIQLQLEDIATVHAAAQTLDRERMDLEETYQILNGEPTENMVLENCLIAQIAQITHEAEAMNATL
ncbi:unnamed protein product [Prorocentrum cordatum]|uniref:Uncharacterized protein n=1 Tax=Prorocentrum cordatum TaxID=2364126 RepID=A0ABN9WA68_9DINO|nr:unnamed protein product [Polarella glacialis]